MPLPAPEYVEKYEYQPLTRRHRLLGALWPTIRFLGGLKLGLTNLTLLLLASTVGEFMDHESGMSLRYVFTTWWYRALLAATGINLVFNTIVTYVEQTYPQFQPIFRKNPDHFSPLKIKHKGKFDSARVGDSQGMMRSLAAAFSARGYNAYFDGQAFYAHRGLLARFGSTITHIGLITIILGALGESFFKQGGIVSIVEGDTVDLLKQEIDSGPPSAPMQGDAPKPGATPTPAPTPKPTKDVPLGFKVQLLDFEHTQYPGTGIASKYKSTVRFIEKDGRRTHDYVRVNHDVTFGGWTFHQSSFTELQRGEYMDRYFVGLTEKSGDGGTKVHNFETFVDPRSRVITPLPGRDDLFFSIEDDPAGQNVIWAVASKEAVLSSGRSPVNNFQISLVRFFPHFGRDEFNTPVNKGDEPLNPAALVEVSSRDIVQFREWVYPSGKAPPRAPFAGGDQSDGGIKFILLDFKADPAKVGSAPDSAAVTAMGAMDPETARRMTLAQAQGGTTATLPPRNEGPLEDRTLVTIELEHQGRPTGRSYSLRKGETVPMSEPVDAGLDIPGAYTLSDLHPIEAYVTHMEVSKNPGIPVVWLGAILASFGPVIAFFVSRRRVWGYVDWTKRQIWLGGESRYSREALQFEMAEIAEAWSKSPEIEIQPPLRFPKMEAVPKLSMDL